MLLNLNNFGLSNFEFFLVTDGIEKKKARTDDIPSSSTPDPPSVTIGQNVQSSLTLVPMLQSLFRG